ncbi:MAG: hypothetical protein IPG00_21195 [Saprospiraceae bacterium]|nr:hypothetical protein [Saprospiraceae bacterium]
MEASLFNNLITLETNYFVRKSKNQILPVGVSNVTGFASYVTNAGVIKIQVLNYCLEQRLSKVPSDGISCSTGHESEAW